MPCKVRTWNESKQLPRLLGFISHQQNVQVSYVPASDKVDELLYGRPLPHAFSKPEEVIRPHEVSFLQKQAGRLPSPRRSNFRPCTIQPGSFIQLSLSIRPCAGGNGVFPETENCSLDTSLPSHRNRLGYPIYLHVRKGPVTFKRLHETLDALPFCSSCITGAKARQLRTSGRTAYSHLGKSINTSLQLPLLQTNNQASPPQESASFTTASIIFQQI